MLDRQSTAGETVHSREFPCLGPLFFAEALLRENDGEWQSEVPIKVGATRTHGERRVRIVYDGRCEDQEFAHLPRADSLESNAGTNLDSFVTQFMDRISGHWIPNAGGDSTGGTVFFPDKCACGLSLEGGGIILTKRGKRERKNRNRDCQRASHCGSLQPPTLLLLRWLHRSCLGFAAVKPASGKTEARSRALSSRAIADFAESLTALIAVLCDNLRTI